MIAADTHTGVDSRRYDIDAIRVLAFGLLIFYHVGMFYVADWEFHVKSHYQSETLRFFMLLVNQWRMPLLFLVSGMASWFLFRKAGARRFIHQRCLRLLLPLGIGMLIVVPPQAYYEALDKGVIPAGYLAFLGRYFTFQEWPEGAFAGSDLSITRGITWNHLWYLVYLLFYTLVFTPVAVWLRPRETQLGARLSRLNGWGLILALASPLTLFGLSIHPISGGVNHGFTSDWYAHAMYFTLFVYGYLIAGNAPLWQTLRKLRYRLLLAAPVSFACLITCWEILPKETSPLEEVALWTVIQVNRGCWLLAVLAWGHHLLNRPFRWLSYANEAVYPWYILHQTLTVAAGYHLARWSLGPIVEPVLVLAITVGGCLLLHESVIRRSRILRPLFGLKPLPRPPVGPQAVGA